MDAKITPWIAGHLLVFILNETADVLSCTLELVDVHMDLVGRRSVVFPFAIVTEIEREVAVSRDLKFNWRIPVGGLTGVRPMIPECLPRGFCTRL